MGNKREYLFRQWQELLKKEVSRSDCDLYHFHKKIAKDFNCSMKEALDIMMNLEQ